MLSLKLMKLSTLFLSILSVVLGLFGLSAKIMIVLSSVCAIFAFTLIVLYLDTNNKQGNFIWAIHSFALHALVFAATMLLFDIDGALYSRWYHAFLDALVVITILILIDAPKLLTVCFAIAIAGCALVNLQLAAQLIFCLLAVFTAFSVVKNFDMAADLGYLLVLIASVLVEKFVLNSNVMYTFHFFFIVFGLVLAYIIAFKQPKKEFKVTRINDKKLETAPIDTADIEVETIDAIPIEVDKQD